MQLSDDENEYMKSMLPKQLSYIPRFALIINVLESIENISCEGVFIEKSSVLKAEKLSNYFIAMAKKIKGESNVRNDIKYNLSKDQGKSNYEKLISIYKNDENINKTELANMLGISRQQVYNYIKKYETIKNKKQ